MLEAAVHQSVYFYDVFSMLLELPFGIPHRLIGSNLLKKKELKTEACRHVAVLLPLTTYSFR